MSTPMLKVELCAGYGKTQTLTDISFELQTGERAGLVGTSGAGKSTLVLALLGLLPWRKGWVKGSVQFDGRNLLLCSERELRKMRGNRIALIPQSPATALNPALSLQTHFDETWRAHAKKGGEQAKRTAYLLERVELPSDSAFLKRRPAEISIGQAQRVMIALALLHRPALLIADEPTSALDVCTQQDILHLLENVSREQESTLLYVSHDLVSLLQLCSRMLVMSHGVLVESLDVESDMPQAQHAVTRKLLETLPASLEELKQTHRKRMDGYEVRQTVCASVRSLPEQSDIAPLRLSGQAQSVCG